MYHEDGSNFIFSVALFAPEELLPGRCLCEPLCLFMLTHQGVEVWLEAQDISKPDKSGSPLAHGPSVVDPKAPHIISTTIELAAPKVRSKKNPRAYP
jgi:hypothetical protein